MITDEQEHIVLQELHDGHAEALDILYLRYAARVRDFAFRMLGDRTEAEDLTHDVFLKVWEQRKSMDRVLSFKSYLFRMIRNAVFNVYKRRQVEYRYHKGVRVRGEFGSQTDECVSLDELTEIIDTAVKNMPQRRREVFCMSRYQDMPYDEIAHTLHISPRTVQYHICGALAELRKLLAAIALFL